MPHSHNPYVERWRLREQVEAGHMKLEEAEIQPFLDYVFGDLGRRPPEIRVREAARVARFLRRLALYGVPKQRPDRQAVSGRKSRDDKTQVSEQDQMRLHDLGERIWNILLQNAPIEPSGPAAAIGFLRRYQPTFLAHHKVVEAVRVIQALELPTGTEDPFPPPNLVSGTVTATGKGNPRLSDDLTDRVYAAYFALRRQKVRRVGPQIADVLTRLGVERKKGSRAGSRDMRRSTSVFTANVSPTETAWIQTRGPWGGAGRLANPQRVASPARVRPFLRARRSVTGVRASSAAVAARV